MRLNNSVLEIHFEPVAELDGIPLSTANLDLN